MNCIRSPSRVTFWHSIIRAPRLPSAARRAFPLAPPAWVRTRTVSGGGSPARLVISSATFFAASAVPCSTMTHPPPNKEGAVIEASSPGRSPAACT